jgi:hypothetical protein
MGHNLSSGVGRLRFGVEPGFSLAVLFVEDRKGAVVSSMGILSRQGL